MRNIEFVNVDGKIEVKTDRMNCRNCKFFIRV